VSDLHCGCRLGLCPPSVSLDSGGTYSQGATQREIWSHWRHFWDVWVPKVCRGEPYIIVCNGDALDGAHHRSKTQISQNFADQANIAYEVLAPEVDRSEGLYMIRGTEAHVGQSAENEEQLGIRLGAIPRGNQHTRFDMWIRVGGSGLCHFAHHIGTTSRAAYETSALMAQLTEMYVESAKGRADPPDCVVRSHRHRHCMVSVPTANTYGLVFTTAGWQGKTPFAYRIPGGITTEPQFGGSIIRQGDEELYARHCYVTLARSRVVTPGGEDEED